MVRIKLELRHHWHLSAHTSSLNRVLELPLAELEAVKIVHI